MLQVSRALLLTVFLLIAAGGQAQDKEKGGDYKGWVEGRRCAYLGQWASFHLIGTGGSAAYFLGNVPFSADLRWTEDDANFFYYEPSNGDPVTTDWAFSRMSDICGMYSVWRHDGSSWQFFERVRAWGRPGSSGSYGSYGGEDERLKARVTQLESRMKKVENKLKEQEEQRIKSPQ